MRIHSIFVSQIEALEREKKTIQSAWQLRSFLRCVNQRLVLYDGQASGNKQTDEWAWSVEASSEWVNLFSKCCAVVTRAIIEGFKKYHAVVCRCLWSSHYRSSVSLTHFYSLTFDCHWLITRQSIQNQSCWYCSRQMNVIWCLLSSNYRMYIKSTWTNYWALLLTLVMDQQKL